MHFAVLTIMQDLLLDKAYREAKVGLRLIVTLTTQLTSLTVYLQYALRPCSHSIGA